MNTSRIVGGFSPHLFGANLQWTTCGDGLLSDQTGGTALDPSHPERIFRNEALQALARLPIGLIRFPGGLLSSLYVWRAGVGPQSARGEGLNYSGGRETMRFGTDEFLGLLRVLKTQGMITFSPKQPAAEAVAWYEHIKQAGGGVEYWEFGNETFLPADPSHMPVAEYTSKFKEFQQALKAAGAKVKTGALLEGSLINTVWGKVVVPELGKWNETVLRDTAGAADFYTAHLYSPFDSGPDATGTLKILAAAPAAMEANLRKLKDLIARQAPKAELWITEYNLGMKTPLEAWKYGTSLAQAGYIASMLMVYARNNVTGANYWSLVGNHNFGLIQTAASGKERPSALLFKMLEPLKGARAIFTAVKAPEFDYQTVGNVGSRLKPKLLDAQAFLSEGVMWVVLINHSMDSPLQVQLFLPTGYAPDSSGDGRVMLEGPNPLAANETETQVALKQSPANSAPVVLPPAGICLVRAVTAKK